MTTLDDLRQIASRLPGTAVSEDRFGLSVTNKGKEKGFVWSWGERVDPKKARVPNNGVMAVVVRNLTEKEMILESDPEKYFTEPHYNGFPAVLVRLAAIDPDELEGLIIEAWRCKAPRNLVAQFDES